MSEHHATIIHLAGVTKTYTAGSREIQALRGIDLEIKSTDFMVVYGPSGCGKSTLLNIIAGAEEPTGGRVTVRDQNLFKMDEDGRAAFRSQKLGIVYQMPYWIRSLNVVENVAMPLIIEGIQERKAVKRAGDLLEELGIGALALQRPTQLSGGEQQKVGFARAVIANPWIIIADEPTGNLDTTASDEVMSLFNTLNVKKRKTIVLVTHNPAYWQVGTRRIEMRDGQILKDTIHG